jgi:sialidase-1
VVYERTDRHCYRIPAIVRSGDRLLAFAERRHGTAGNPCADHGNVDIVVRVSTDGGRAWSDERVVVDHARYQLGGSAAATNPSPVALARGEVWLLFNVSRDRDGRGNEQARIQAGDPNVDRTAHWLVLRGVELRVDAPTEITSQIVADDWRWFGFGPGHGIVSSRGEAAGRVVVPAYFSRAGPELRSHSTVIVRDAAGSWRRGGHTGDTVEGQTSSEAQVAELSDGALMLNSRRVVKDHLSSRRVALSRDGGDSWEPSVQDSALPSPISHGTLLAIEHRGRHLLLFANPSCRAATRSEDPSSRFRMRRRMTLRVSEDDGGSWPRRVVVRRGSSGYPDMVGVDSEHVGLLYEAPAEIDESRGARRFGPGWYENGITFAVVPIAAARVGPPLPECISAR